MPSFPNKCRLDTKHSPVTGERESPKRANRVPTAAPPSGRKAQDLRPGFSQRSSSGVAPFLLPVLAHRLSGGRGFQFERGEVSHLRRLKVLIADDHQLMLAAIRASLSHQE